MKTKSKKEYKAEDLVLLIRKRFESRNGLYNQYIVLEQVPDGTGGNQTRWIDAAVFQMWPSKGLTRAAFEIKISRSDFLHELQMPEKHQWCRDSFHEFWFVAPKGIIQLEELPKGIGWMYPHGGNLCVARNAIRNDKVFLNDDLLAGLMRAAYKEIQSANKLSKKKILEDSREYKEARFYYEAIQRFFNNRNIIMPFPDSSDAIYSKLEEATIDKKLKQDCDQLLRISGRFQREIANLLNIFLVIARKSIVARDEMGNYIVKEYGVNDENGVEILKELANNPKASDYQKRYAEILTLIMNWEKLQS